MSPTLLKGWDAGASGQVFSDSESWSSMLGLFRVVLEQGHMEPTERGPDRILPATPATPIVYADGAGALVVIDGVAKFNFFQDFLDLQQDGGKPDGNNLVRRVSAQVVLSLPALLRTHSWLGEIIDELKAQGLDFKLEKKP